MLFRPMLSTRLTEKELPGKNKDSCMFVLLSTHSLSMEALKSAPSRIGLAAIWTWAVVVRSLHYQRSRCQACCLGWAEQHRMKRQLLSWGACTQVSRNSPIHVSAPFPQGMGGWDLPKGLALGHCGMCQQIGIHLWWQPERLWQGNKAMWIPRGLSSRSNNWGFYWLCITSWGANNPVLLEQLQSLKLV